MYQKSMLAVAIALATSVPAFAEPVETEAVIVTHNGGQIAARSREGPVAIAITDATEIREKKGLSKKARNAKSLIPGLIITVEGDRQGDTIHASKIDFNERDWRTAIATKAGTAELRQAVIDGNEYVIQKETAVYFPVGKATLSPKHKADLQELAKQAHSFGNYRISILGFADPTGNAAANERLSLQRAHAVSAFLRQTGSVQPGRVLSPSAMGEGTTAPGESAPATAAEARRVLVRIVTPKTQLTQ